MASIKLLYATKVNLGGWATFTVHLHKLLEAAGHQVELIKIGNRTEPFHRPFAGHGLSYRNVAASELGELHKRGTRCIVAALGKHYVDDVSGLLKKGAGIVVHDTAESTNRMDIKRPWVIRKALVPLFEEAVFIRHPYVRHEQVTTLPMSRRKGYVATSRVDFDKNTAMILDANRLGAGIDIVGFENRLYTKFKICPNYPEWEQSTGLHPRSGQASFELLRISRGMVDLTDIKRDGGGTQYTFLEAWDAGAVPIIGKWWLRPKDDMVDGLNCLSVESAEQMALMLKKFCKSNTDMEDIAGVGQRRLAKYHSPKVIAPQVISWLDSL